MVKTFKNLLLLNQKVDGLWHWLLRYYQICSNDDPGSLTFVQGHSDSNFQTSFPDKKYTGPIEARFHVESPWDGGMKVSTNGICCITKMAAMSIYGKNL